MNHLYDRMAFKRLGILANQWFAAPRQFIYAICAATAEILFLRGVRTGALLLSTMVLQPSVLLMGLTGVLAAVVFARVTQLGQTYLERAPLLFNPLLAGLSVGYLFKLSPASLFLSAAAGVLAFLFTYALSHILYTYFFLPVLSLPFIAVSWIIHLAAFRYAGLEHAIVPAYDYSIGMPVYLEGFLRTLGLIFFLPNIWVGMVVAVLLLFNSRIQFLLAVSSYFLGTTIRGVLTGTFVYVYFDPAALNYILVALAIGGFYLLPSPRNYMLAALGVALAALLEEAVSVFWAAVFLPVHALPYNLVTLLLLYLLGVSGYRWLALYPQSSPEKTLDYELTARLRYQGKERAIALPFSGNWVVWQGFNGKWTHQGVWRHAYDFVIQDKWGQTFHDSGLQLTDYYAFRKPVLSPIQGWVIWVVRDLPDGAIGSVDSDNNWGNYVVLYSERGFYVEISHFAQDSIVVNPGERIERDAFIGLCGNSGYSPQPHIHIQVQLVPQIGAATVPFCFSNLIVDGEFFTECIPAENTLVEPILCDTALLKSLTFTLDSQLHFSITQKGRAIGELVATVRMAKDSSFYLDSGKGKLFFSRDQDKFMFHRLEGEDPGLKLLFLAIPKLPLVRTVRQQWFDYLPISMVIGGWRRRLYQFFSSFLPQLASAKYVGQWQSDLVLTGTVAIPNIPKSISTSATFDCYNQLVMVTVGDKALVRLYPDAILQALVPISH